MAAPRRTTAELLAWLREVDPNATVSDHKWGFSVVDTSALDTPQVLLTNSRAVRQA